MEFLPYITAGLGGLNVFQAFILIATMRSQRRKESALASQEESKAVQEEANSVTKTQEIYDRLTATIQREREYFDGRYEKVILKNQELEIMVDTLKRQVTQYQEKCKLCSNNTVAA